MKVLTASDAAARSNSGSSPSLDQSAMLLTTTAWAIQTMRLAAWMAIGSTDVKGDNEDEDDGSPVKKMVDFPDDEVWQPAPTSFSRRRGDYDSMGDPDDEVWMPGMVGSTDDELQDNESDRRRFAGEKDDDYQL